MPDRSELSRRIAEAGARALTRAELVDVLGMLEELPPASLRIWFMGDLLEAITREIKGRPETGQDRERRRRRRARRRHAKRAAEVEDVLRDELGPTP